MFRPPAVYHKNIVYIIYQNTENLKASARQIYFTNFYNFIKKICLLSNMLQYFFFIFFENFWMLGDFALTFAILTTSLITKAGLSFLVNAKYHMDYIVYKLFYREI